MYWHDSRRVLFKKWRLFLFILCLWEGNAARSAQVIWIKQATGPGPGSVHAFAIDPMAPNTMYAGTTYILASVDGSSGTLDGGGVFKSTDGGTSWLATGLKNNSVASLAINPAIPATLYAGMRNGVSKSTDGGASWVAVGPPEAPYIAALAIHPSAPDTLYAGTYRYGVLKSIDGGVTWVAANTGLTNLDVLALAIDPLAPNTLYAGTGGGGIFKSMDGGTTWAAANAGLTNLNVRTLAINPGSPDRLYVGTGGGGVFKSTDGGVTWRSSNIPTHNYVYALAINPTTPATLYAGTNFDGVFKSTDSGSTWTNIGLTGNPVLSLAINPATPSIVYAGTLEGVFRYEEASSPIPATSDSDRIFNYLEAIYPQYLVPAQAASATAAEYYYRYYSGTHAYIATANGMVYYLGPASGNSIHLVGTQAELFDAAKQSGY